MEHGVTYNGLAFVAFVCSILIYISGWFESEQVKLDNAKLAMCVAWAFLLASIMREIFHSFGCLQEDAQPTRTSH